MMDSEILTASIAIHAGIFCKRWTIHGRGVELPQHVHQWPHLTLVEQGSVLVTRGGTDLGTFREGDHINIRANEPHTFFTLSDFTRLACIHSTHFATIDDLKED
jgi:quercetin dioxygenase-like cupin family protein